MLKEGYLYDEGTVRKRELKAIQKYKKEKNYRDLLMTAIFTKSEKVMTEAIQILYQTGNLEFLDDLYCAVSMNQTARRKVLYTLYEAECKEIQSKPIKDNVEQNYYEQKLQLMLFHTLSVPRVTPEYGNLLSDLVISSVPSPILVKDCDLILNNYPEKEINIRTRLLETNHLQSIFAYIQLFLRRTKTLDLSLVSYLFFRVEPIYCKEKEPSKEIKEMYETLKTLVLEHNQQIVTKWQEENPSLLGIYSKLLNPEIPILSILNILPVKESLKEEMICSLDCDGILKDEMLEAFRNREENKDTCADLDVYYVLNQNYIPKKMNKIEQPLIEKAKKFNQNYYYEMFMKKRMGLVNTEDIIGAIGELVPKPIFGLFSLLGEVPMEDLLAIISNLSFEDINQKNCFIHYLEQVTKLHEKAYTPEYVEMDIHYVMCHLKEQNSVLDEKSAKKKEI